MRVLPQTLADALASGCTTLCRCWQLARRDGQVLGFTDHDRDLDFDGVTHQASAGLTAGTVEQSTGLSVDSRTVSGALSSASITENDVLRGLYDGAEVRQYLVDWQDVTSRTLMSVGRVGEIRRRGQAFEAEVLGLAEQLNRPFGRAFTPTCPRILGDAGCGVDLTASAYHGTGTVTGQPYPTAIETADLGSFAEGLFAAGRLVWTSGANLGAEQHVRRHAVRDGTVLLETWLAPPLEVAIGDTFRVEAGCDRRFETCRDRFANALAFAGFPHIPGDDVAIGYPSEGGSHDGGSLFR